MWKNTVVVVVVVVAGNQTHNTDVSFSKMGLVRVVTLAGNKSATPNPTRRNFGLSGYQTNMAQFSDYFCVVVVDSSGLDLGNEWKRSIGAGAVADVDDDDGGGETRGGGPDAIGLAQTRTLERLRTVRV